MRSNVVAEASAIGRLTSTVLKSSARKEIMNDGESKDGNISAESSIFDRKIADQQGSSSVLYLHWLTKTTTTKQSKQFYRKIEKKRLGQNYLILSGLTVFWNNRSHCQRYTSVHWCFFFESLVTIRILLSSQTIRWMEPLFMVLGMRSGAFAEASATRRSSSSKLIASTKA